LAVALVVTLAVTTVRGNQGNGDAVGGAIVQRHHQRQRPRHQTRRLEVELVVATLEAEVVAGDRPAVVTLLTRRGHCRLAVGGQGSRCRLDGVTLSVGEGKLDGDNLAHFEGADRSRRGLVSTFATAAPMSHAAQGRQEGEAVLYADRHLRCAAVVVGAIGWRQGGRECLAAARFEHGADRRCVDESPRCRGGGIELGAA